MIALASLARLNEESSVNKERPFIVAAIPAFNVEKTVAGVVLGAQKYVDVVLVCDDGSTDLTGEIAEGLGADVVRYGRNLGYEG